MFRPILIAGLVCLSAATAHAKCSTPELEIGFDKEIGESYNGNYDYTNEDDDVEFSIKLSIPLGKHVQRACDAEIAYDNNKSIHEFYKAKTAEAKARAEEAKADEQEQDNLEQKIEICSEFTYDEAPNSIRKFCGDLLQ